MDKYLNSISCLERYRENSKTVNGYHQLNPMFRALGFDNGCSIQDSLNNGYRHLINASDVETVAEWLFENGYDIIKLR